MPASRRCCCLPKPCRPWRWPSPNPQRRLILDPLKPKTLWNSAAALKDRFRRLVMAGKLSRFLDSLTLHDLRRCAEDWPVFAGQKQRPPLGNWRTWLMLGGRGAGKTMAGARWLTGLVYPDGHYQGDAAGRVAIIGETYGDARAVMVEGESGLIAIAAAQRRPQWNASKRELVWPNGTIGQVFSAADPEGLRGSQFGAAWCDDLGRSRPCGPCRHHP